MSARAPFLLLFKQFAFELHGHLANVALRFPCLYLCFFLYLCVSGSIQDYVSCVFVSVQLKKMLLYV